MKLKDAKKKDPFKTKMTDSTKSLFGSEAKAPLNLSVHKSVRKAFIVLAAKREIKNNELFTDMFLHYVKINKTSVEDLCK